MVFVIQPQSKITMHQLKVIITPFAGKENVCSKEFLFENTLQNHVHIPIIKAIFWGVPNSTDQNRRNSSRW